MSNLLVEIGNTALKAAWSEKMTLGKTFRYQGEKVQDFILSLTEKEKPEVMVISSVYKISDKDAGIFENQCAHLIILDSVHTDILKENKLSLQDFLLSVGLKFDDSTMLPVVLLENVDLQTLNFTNETIAKEIY